MAGYGDCHVDVADGLGPFVRKFGLFSDFGGAADLFIFFVELRRLLVFVCHGGFVVGGFLEGREVRSEGREEDWRLLERVEKSPARGAVTA